MKEDDVVTELRRVFDTGETRSAEWRLSHLKAMKRMLIEHESEFIEALGKDLGKSHFEAKAEVSSVIVDIKIAQRCPEWMKPEKKQTPALLLPASTEVHNDPMGVALIISPFNFPVNQPLKPMVSAIAAGNCVVIKPAEKCIYVEALLVNLFPKYMDPKFFRVITGGPEVVKKILTFNWDIICFTGSGQIGKLVAKAAAENLTPVILELGGKNPVIVDENPGNLDVLAKRLIASKFMNAGQLCISTDYVVCLEGVAKDFEEACVRALKDMFGDDPRASEHYGRLVDAASTERVKGLLDTSVGRLVCGGEVSVADRYVAPTIIAEEPLDSPISQTEIFGPVVCFYTVKDLDAAAELVHKISHRHPLALYIFTKNKQFANHCLTRIQSGGAVINDLVFQIFVSPFGGKGQSGYGYLGGHHGYNSFTHKRSVVKRYNLRDVPYRFPPYNIASIGIAQFARIHAPLPPWFLKRIAMGTALVLVLLYALAQAPNVSPAVEAFWLVLLHGPQPKP